MTDAEPDKRDFFVSFNQADRAWATWIAWVLEEVGYSVLFQDWDFRGSFMEEMHQANLRCAHTLIVLSDNYLRSEFARSEAWAAMAGDAVGRKDRIVTIKVGPTGELGQFAHFAHLDLSGEAAADAERLLCERAKKSLDLAHRSKPAIRPPFPGSATPRPGFPTPAPGPKLAVNNLPPANPDFVGREGVLIELRRLLAAGQGPAVLTQAITGLGGIGKTQTARAYAYRHLTDYELIWWLRAETPATLAADYAALAAPLGLDPDTADQTKLNSAIRQQLQSRSAWLLIFDNVEDPKLPREWLPSTGGGHSLITSRRTDWQGLAKRLSLPVMQEDEAIEILTGSSDGRTLLPAEHAAASDLARELGYLPLALAQSRAYMVETGRSLASYLSLFRSSRPPELAAYTTDPDYPASYATTWRISIHAAATACPAARPLLELLAFFAPDPLPIEVLGADPEALCAELRDERARHKAIAALRRYSLITTEVSMISVHRLIQTVARNSLDEPTAQACSETAVRLVNAALPRPPMEHTNWPTYATLLNHGRVVAGWSEQWGAGLESAAAVLHETAMYHHARASWSEAEPLIQRAITIGQKVLGQEHLAFATMLNSLANIYRATGRYAKAEPLYRDIIAIGEKALGSDHPHVAVWLNNLAGLYWTTGRHPEAEPLYQRAITIGERTLDPDHPALIARLNNLATVYQTTGRYAEAERLLQRIIASSEKALGSDHPNLAIVLNNLADLSRSTGRYAEAEPLLQRTIAIDEKSLGSDHPNLAIGLNNLASLYQDTNRHAEAEPLYQRAIAIGENTLGRNHPDLAVWLANLAALYANAERHAEAKPLYQRAIAILEASLPTEHPYIARVRASYVALLISSGHSDATRPSG